MALRQALTLAEQAGKIVVNDVKTTGKTTEVVKFLADNKLDRKVLLVVDEKTPELIRATNNMQNVLLVSSNVPERLSHPKRRQDCPCSKAAIADN